MRTSTPTPSDAGRVAIVVFEHRDDVGILRWLRPGFRHCFCLLSSPYGWLLCDPLKSGLCLDLLPSYDSFALLAHYSAPGRHALLGCVGRLQPRPHLAIRPLTCVEVVKRALGVEAPATLTPYQLHRKLISTGDWLSAEVLYSGA